MLVMGGFTLPVEMSGSLFSYSTLLWAVLTALTPKITSAVLVLGILVILGLITRHVKALRVEHPVPFPVPLKKMIVILSLAYLSSIVIGFAYMFWVFGFDPSPPVRAVLDFALDGNSFLLFAVVQEGTLLLVILVFFVFYYKDLWRVVGLSMKSMTTKRLAGMGLLGLGGLWLIYIGQYFLVGPPASEEPEFNLILLRSLDLPHRLLYIIWGGSATVMIEEIVFRGILYSAIKERLGVYFGIAVSSLLFAMAQSSSPLSMFLFGCVLAWLYERTGSLYPSMIAHGANNVIAASLKLLRI
jgi:membrane protease YdiL (CAAX protease family)